MNAITGTVQDIRSPRRSIVPYWLASDLGFLLMFVLLALSALWSYIGHRRFVAPELQYIPRENTVLVVTGPIESIWLAFDKHFGSIIRSAPADPKRKKGLAKLIDGVQSSLRDQRLPVAQLSALAEYGIDSKRGIFVSLYRADDKQIGPFVAVFPVLAQSTFTQTLQRYLSIDKMEAVRIPGATAATEVFKAGDWYVAFPERGIALISDNAELSHFFFASFACSPFIMWATRCLVKTLPSPDQRSATGQAETSPHPILQIVISAKSLTRSETRELTISKPQFVTPKRVFDSGVGI